MKISRVSLILVLCTLMGSLSGCANIQTGMKDAMNQNKEVVFSVADKPSKTIRNELDWVELDQLNNFKTLRREWDDAFNIMSFDTNSKNGVMYVELDGSWAGNNTMYNCFRNKVFMNDYWADGEVKSKISKAAMHEFSDVTNESMGLTASVNAYFNLLTTNANGTSGMTNVLTRAEAMAMLYRADTPVTLLDVPEEFMEVVGENDFNIYAYDVAKNSYLDYTNGSLNSTAYNSAITRAEAIYMLINRYFPEELASANVRNITFNDCINAGEIEKELGFEGGHAWQAYTLEYCLQNQSSGVCEDLFKALVVARDKGIISSDTYWFEGITAGSYINMLLKTYQAIYDTQGYLVNAKAGKNAGQSLYVKNEPKEDQTTLVDTETGEIVVEPEDTDVVIEITGSHKLSDLADIDDLINAYPDEIDMTDEEIEEAKEIGDQFTIEEYDTYLKVDYCRFLNLRTGPDTSYRIIKSIPKGTEVHIVGICKENGWYRVIANGKISYQCGVYFSELD